MTPAPFSAVVVGSGVAGAIVAKELGLRGFRVLVLEAGLESPMDDAGFRGHVRSYLAAPARGPNSPYPRNPNAPHPEPSDLPLDRAALAPARAGENGYLVQRGPMPFSSGYTRYLGGTTLQWLGTSLRMLPSDFRLRSLYGRGVDWPLAYEDLAPFYARAEGELGVAADAEEQTYLGVSFPDGYAYPMEPVPPSYSDALVAAGLEGMRFHIGDEVLPVQVSSTAQARNTRPNPRRDPGSEGHSSDPWAREALVDGEGLFGRGLRRALFDRVQRQLRFGFVVEQEPCATNRVTLDPAFRDALGEPRPVITYDLSEYVRAGIATARRFSEQAFARLGVEDCTAYSPEDPRHFLHEGAGYSWWGSGHSMGTHRMGSSARDSVVDADQRSWDHPNLYLVGAGSFPTAGTANPTLTLAALAFRSVERMARDLAGNGA